MTPMARRYYGLEKLWRKGQPVDLSGLIKPNLPEGVVAGARRGGPEVVSREDEAMEEEEDDGLQLPGKGKEDDPFWS